MIVIVSHQFWQCPFNFDYVRTIRLYNFTSYREHCSQAISHSFLLTAYVTFELSREVGEGLDNFYVIKLQGGLNRDVMWTPFQ